MDILKYTSIFASTPIKCVVSEERDILLSIASLKSLEAFIPKIDPKNIDLLPISFNAAVVGRGNKNGDIIDTDTGLSIYKTFINKPLDVEHNRKSIIGVVLTAYLTEFGTDKLLTEEDVKGKDTPFNITLGGVLWKVVNSKLCDLVEEASDPDSDNYMLVSSSWELAFSGFDIVEMDQGEKNLSKGTIIKNPEQIETLKKYLKSSGGSGVKDGKSYYRMPNQDVIAMGIGLTEKPAAEVHGISVKPDEKVDTKEEAKANTSEENKKIISQPQIINVKRERETNMKITSLKDITDESLKQCSASEMQASVAEFISSELKKASENFTAEKAQAATLQTNLQASAEELKKSVSEMKASLENLQKEKSERDRVDAFNVRMTEVSASYELPQDVAKVIVDDLKSLANEEAYAAWKVKAETLLKPYSKAEAKVKEDAKKKADDEAKAKQAKADDEMEAKKKTDDEAKAKESLASTVDNALDNSDKEKGGIPNSSSASAPGLKERFGSAFAEDGFIFTK